MSSPASSSAALPPRPSATYAMPSLAAYSLRDSAHTGPSTAPSSSSRGRPRSATISSSASAVPPAAAPMAPSLRNIYGAVPRAIPPTSGRKRGNTFSMAMASSSQPSTSLPASRRSSYPHPSLPQINLARHAPTAHPQPAPYRAPSRVADPARQESVSEMMKRATLDDHTSPSLSPGSHSPALPTIPDSTLTPPPPATAAAPQETGNILNRIETITRPVELTIQTLLFRIFRTIQVEFLRYPPCPDTPDGPRPEANSWPSDQTATSGYMCLLLLGHVPPQNPFDAAWLSRVQQRLQTIHARPELLNFEEGGVCSVRDIGDMFQMLRVLVGCIRRVSDVMVRSGVLGPPATASAPVTAPNDASSFGLKGTSRPSSWYEMPPVKEGEMCDPGFALPKYHNLAQGLFSTGPGPLDLIAPEMAHVMESLAHQPVDPADPAPPAKRARPMAPLPRRSPPPPPPPLAAPQIDGVNKARAWLSSQASYDRDSAPLKRPLKPEL